jgi:hypothetical protein
MPRQKDDAKQGAEFNDKGDNFRHCCLLSGADFRSEQRLPDIAGKKVCGADRHDRSRDKRANGDCRETEARELFRENTIEQRWNDFVGVRNLDPVSDCHVSEQRHQAKEQCVGRQ